MIEPPALYNLFNIVIVMYIENKTVVWITTNYPSVPNKIFQIYEEELIEQLHNQTNN